MSDGLINVFIDSPSGRGLTVVSTFRSSAVPLMDYIVDAGFRVCHDGWYTLQEEAEQRATAVQG